jgi:ATP-dependent DNA helicase DinG
VIEVEVHQQLRAFLREQGEPDWPHHLTMARLVARALRLGRSALIQAGAPSGHHGRYRLSYLMPLLLWQESAMLVAPEAVLQRLLMVEVPRLRQWITTEKSVRRGDYWTEPGLLLTTPQVWLADRLHQQGRFPDHILTVVDGAEQIEDWTRRLLTLTLESHDWDQLMQQFPQQADLIRDLRVQLTCSIFQHPANPYDRYLLEPPDRLGLRQLFEQINSTAAWPPVWQQLGERLQDAAQIAWAEVARPQGQFSLHLAPAEVAPTLQTIWAQQPVVLIGGALDLETDAAIFRQRLGLADLTCVKFSPHRQHELVQLYLPDGLPMPTRRSFSPF